MNVRAGILFILLTPASWIGAADRSSYLSVKDARPAPYQELNQWYVWAPKEHLAPSYAVSSNRLILESNGSEGCLGKWAVEIADLSPGQWYRIGASYKTYQIDEPDQSVIGVTAWLNDARRPTEQDYLLEAGGSEGWQRIEQILRMPTDATRLEIGLYLRWAAKGKVAYRKVSIERVEPPRARKVKLAVVNFKPRGAKGPDESLAQFESYLNEAGGAGADIVCIGETVEMAGTNQPALETATELGGRNTRRLREIARKHRMYIVGSVNIREDGQVRNMGVLINRDGEIAGTYRKVHLPFAEVLNGVVPGDEFPVFETDFGKVGMQICYDNFFPESARSLALNGAEIIFLPIWGDGRWDDTAWEVMTRSRAIDNSVYFVASRYDGGRSMIVDPAGKILQDSGQEQGVFIYEVDLNSTTRNRWLSVSGRGEWENLYPKERRPGAYRAITRSE